MAVFSVKTNMLFKITREIERKKEEKKKKMEWRAQNGELVETFQVIYFTKLMVTFSLDFHIVFFFVFQSTCIYVK